MFNNVLFQRSLRTRNKTEAAQLEAVFRSSLVKGEFGIVESRSAPTLEKFQERLLPHLKANTAERTFEFYKQNLSVLMRYVPMASCKLGSIDSALIENFIQWRLKEKVATVTVNHSLRTLRRALHIAKDWRLIRDVPTITLLPGEHEREAVIDEPTLTMMVKWIAKAYPSSIMHHLLPFLVDTGLRITEACMLQRAHVTFDDGCPVAVRVVKGKSKYAKREVPLTARAAAVLEACLKKSRSEWVFCGKGGKHHMTRHYPSEMFRTIRDAMNLDQDMVLHSTRHTFCTRLGNEGCDAFTIQKLAGHSSIVISQRYVHSDQEAKQSAIRLLDALNNKKGSAPVRAPSDKVKEI
jgi:site-specific recombinase XerD